MILNSRGSGAVRQLACFVRSTLKSTDLFWLPSLDTFRTFLSFDYDFLMNLSGAVSKAPVHQVHQQANPGVRS